MIFLKSTQKIKLTTNSVSNITVQANFVDVIATESATPNNQLTTITAATTTDIVSSPDALIVRQIKAIFISNVGTMNNTVNVNLNNGVSDFKLCSPFTLQPNESVFYEDGKGWTIGNILVNTLTEDYHTSYQDWQTITDPVAPEQGDLRVYAKNVAGRTLPKWKTASGFDTPFQPALFVNNVIFWQPGATSGVLNGSVGTAIAAGVAVAPTTTNRYTSLRRSVFTTATGINLMNSYRTENMFFRGAVPSMGGFFAFFRFGLNVYNAGSRMFVGLAVDTTAMLTTADPSTKFNLCGFGFDAADTRFSFIHNDGAGLGVKETIGTQPGLQASNAYDAYVYCRPNDTRIYYRLDDITNQITIVDAYTDNKLPLNTTMLNAQIAVGNGALTGANSASFGLSRMYIESDY